MQSSNIEKQIILAEKEGRLNANEHSVLNISDLVKQATGKGTSYLTLDQCGDIVAAIKAPALQGFFAKIKFIEVGYLFLAPDEPTNNLWEFIVRPLIASPDFIPNILVTQTFVDTVKILLPESIATGRIFYSKPGFQYRDNLCKEFLTQLKGDLSYAGILDAIDTVSGNNPTKHHHICRVLKEMGVDKALDCDQGQRAAFREILTTIAANCPPIKDEFYFAHKDGLYFNLVRVTDKNLGFWDELASKNAHGKNCIGTGAFRSSIKNYDAVNLYVAFITDTPVTNPYGIRESSIEMFVSRANGLFGSNIGIARAGDTYSGVKHSNISIKLFAFIEEVTQMIGRVTWMINHPADAMMMMLYDAFEKNTAINKMHIGHNLTPPPSESEIFQYSVRAADCLMQHRDKVLLMHSTLLEMISNQTKSPPPIKLTPLRVKGEFDFQIHNPDGTITSISYAEQVQGSCDWFFNHPNQKLSGSLTFCCESSALAEMHDFKETIQCLGDDLY